MSKPPKPGRKFSPHKWGVTLDFAFTRIKASVGTFEFAEDDINEGLRSGRLKSGEWQISSEGEGTWRHLYSSDWARRKVGAYPPMLAPAPGVFALPPREGTYIEGPQFEGKIFICRADLDEYPTAAPPTATQSDGAEPTSNRRKPGPKIRHDWRLHVAAEVHRIKESGKKTPSAAELAQFCYNKWKWQPDESDIQKLLKYLLND